ncbi:MAG: AI-2E family transporter [Roseiflexaceae bacterium]|nr:AI-2E family transporter [Roseiflexaceae bacterium]
MMRKIAIGTTTVLSVLICTLALWTMREAVQLLIIALAISAAMTPLIEYLIARGLKRLWAIILTFVGVIMPLLTLIVILGIQAISDLGLLLERAPSQYNQMRQMLLNEGAIAQYIGRVLPDSQTLMKSLTSSNIESLGLTVVSTIMQALVVGILLLSIASLGFYWLADQQRIERLLLSLLPSQHRSSARSLWNQMYHEVGVMIRGEIVLIVCGVVALFIVYRLLGIQGASLLALFGGLMLLVPVLSIPLALLPGVLVASLQNPLQGFLVLGCGALLLLAIKRGIGPRIFRSGMIINPVLIVVLIMVLAEFAGFWAFLIALPLAAAIQTIGRAVRSEQQRYVPVMQTIEVQALQERIEFLAHQVANETPEAVRIKGLLGRAQKLAADVALLVGQNPQQVAENTRIAQADLRVSESAQMQ